MSLAIANRGSMCSTLILGGVSGVTSLEGGVGGLIPLIKNSINYSENPENKIPFWTPSTCEVYKDHKVEKQILDGYKVKDFAFVTGTCYANSPRSKRTMDVLKEFGFTLTEWTSNKKNGTTVCMFWISVAKMMERLAFYDKKAGEKNPTKEEEIPL